MASNTETAKIEVLINGQQANDSLKEMQANARKLWAELRRIPDPLNSPEYAKGIKALDEMNRKIDEIKQKTKESENAWKRMLEVAGGMGMMELAKKGIELVGKGFEWLKTVMESTEEGADKLKEMITAMDWGYQAFLRTIATGDWSNLLDNVTKAIEAGKEYAQILDDLEKRQRSFDMQDSDRELLLTNLRKQQKDATLPTLERAKIGLQIYQLETKKLSEVYALKKQDLDATLKQAETETKLSSFQILSFEKNYRDNAVLVKQAEEYLTALKERGKAEDDLTAAQKGSAKSGGGENVITAQQNLDRINKIINEVPVKVKVYSDIVQAMGTAAGKTLDDLRDKYKNLNSAQSDVIKEGRRSWATFNNDLVELGKEGVKKADDAQKAYSKHMEVLNVIQQAQSEAMVDLNLNEQERARAKEEFDYQQKVAALKKKSDGEKDTQEALNKALEKMEAAHLIRMMQIQEDYEEKKKTITVKTSAFSSFELPKQLEKVKTDQSAIDNEIQKHLDERMKFEAEADLLALTRTGQLTYQKKKELLKQEETMELAVAAGNSEKQYLIKEQFFQKEKELTLSHINEMSSMANGLADTIGNIYNSFVQAQNASDQAALANYQNVIEKRKSALQDSYDRGLITKEQYDKSIVKADKELAAERQKVAEAQAEREYKMATFMILLKGAIAIASAVALGVEAESPIQAIIQVIATVATVISELSLAESRLDAARAAQYARGKYDVLGASDGKLYQGVPYTGAAQTGIYPRPALISEQGPELIVDAPTTRNLQMNYPWVLSAINYARTPQHAAGNYPFGVSDASGSAKRTTQDPYLASSIDRLNANIEAGILAKIVYSEFETAKGKVDLIETKVSKS